MGEAGKLSGDRSRKDSEFWKALALSFEVSEICYRSLRQPQQT